MSSIKPQSWLILILISLIWGSSFILMKRGLEVFSDFQVANMRIFFSMLTLLPLALFYLQKVSRKDLIPIALVAVIGSGIPPFLFTIAQTQITSAATGVLNALTPLFALIVGILVFKNAFHRKQFTGVLVGFIGAISLLLMAPTLDEGGNHWYGLFVVAATICYAFSVNVIKKYCQNISPITLNILVFSIIGPFAGIMLFSTDFVSLLSTGPKAWEAFAYVLILAVLGTAFATILFFQLVQQTDAIFASTTTYLIPIVAVLWGLFDGESIGWEYLIGLGLILSGVYLVSSKA